MKIVSNCPLCGEHSLHVIEADNIGTQQCINCGYATTNRFKFTNTKEDNEMYKVLPKDMQGWSKEANGRVWIPSMITLPFGTLYPENVGDEMKWSFAEMVDIPEEEQKNYPDERGGYFKQRYDTENSKRYDLFIEAMAEMNNRAKSDGPKDITTEE